MIDRKPNYQPARFGRAHRNFVKKVETLENWVKQGGGPDGCVVPNGPVALAKWQDQSLGFGIWSSPNIASPTGPYPDLRARFDKALAALIPATENSPQSNDREVLLRYKTIIRSLAEQNTELIERNTHLVEELERTQQLLRLALERERKVARDRAVLRPINGLKK